MDRETLKNLAAARRSQNAEPVKARVNWGCEYCGHNFTTESGFMKHKCKGRERLDELQSVIGQAAYAHYATWMKLNRRTVPVIETFADSTLYSSFIKFATWAKKVRLPNTDDFIRAMVENGKVPPSLWCRDNVYAMYLQGYDAVVPPDVQFLRSFDEVSDLSRELKVPMCEVFDKAGVDVLLDMIQKRKISPWFLVASSVFQNWIRSIEAVDADKIKDALQIGAMLNRITHSEKLKAMLVDFSQATKEIGL